MRPAARFIRIIAIFLLIGPPVGGITLWVAVLSFGLENDAFSHHPLQALAGIILFSYPFGGLFALTSGTCHAVSAIWLRWNSVLVPLIAGSMLSAVDDYFFKYHRHSDWLAELEKTTAVSVAPMLAASLACWRISHRFAREM
jgi:hypothetical protein